MHTIKFIHNKSMRFCLRKIHSLITIILIKRFINSKLKEYKTLKNNLKFRTND